MHPPAEERPTGPGGRLADRLSRMRKNAGLNQNQMAVSLGWTETSGRPRISKIENGLLAPSPDAVRKWAEITGHPETASELLDLLADLKTVHTRWRQQMKGGFATVQQDRDRITQNATRIRDFETVLVPGLLQTSGYARAVYTQLSAFFAKDVDAAVQARMERQQVLYDTSKRFEFLITESVLRLLSCPREVMLGQLDRLLSLGMNNVTLGIIPFGTELPAIPYNSFGLEDDFLTVETLTGTEKEDAGPKTAVYHQMFDALMAEALTGDDARRLIMAAADDLRQNH